MRTFKMVGLAVVAALTAMALIGASSALAKEHTALCEEDTSPCPLGKLVSHVHELTLKHGILLSSVLDVECNVLFLGDVLSKGLLSGLDGLGNILPLEISGAFTYSNCLNGCKATEENGPARILLLKEGHDLAKVTGHGLVLVNCSLFGIHCTYNGEGLVGHALGALLSEHKGGEVKIEKALVNIDIPKLSFCPAEGFLDLLIGALEGVNTYITT